MTIDRQAILMQPGQGSSYWVLGDLYTFKAVGEETGQAYALVEVQIQPQNGSPPHVHSYENEAFYIQEGTFEFQLDEQVVVATPGTFLHSPKGQLHRFTNTGSTPGKMLIWVTPAGLENFFREVGQSAVNPASPPTVTSEDIEKVMALAPQYGLEIFAPPP